MVIAQLNPHIKERYQNHNETRELTYSRNPVRIFTKIVSIELGSEADLKNLAID